MIALDFTVPGIPLSAQTKLPKARSGWKHRVRTAAKSRRSDSNPVVTEELSAAIVYFYEDETDIDVDNIAKPILDALCGIVYLDDSQVSQVVVRKTRIAGGLIVNNPSPSLAMALDAGGDFVYVKFYGPLDHRNVP